MREIGAKAFYRCNLLENVSLNEGLEKLGAKETVNGREYEGAVFERTAIKNIRIPSTLKRLERSTFYHCSDLECVELLSGVEYIGQECFGNSYLQQLMLPSTVKEICENAMDECDYLKLIWVEDDCAVDIWKCMGDFVTILPAALMVGNVLLRDLR